MNHAQAIKQNQTLPFFYTTAAGKVVLQSADGKTELPRNFTGLACTSKSVTDLWYLGEDQGERSYTKLNATLKSDALIELQQRGISIN